MSGEFFDSKVILYLPDETGPKRDRALSSVNGGGATSVRILYELLVDCRRKARMTWKEPCDRTRAVSRLL